MDTAGLPCSIQPKIGGKGHGRHSIVLMAALNVYLHSLLSSSAYFTFLYILIFVLFSAPDGIGRGKLRSVFYVALIEVL